MKILIDIPQTKYNVIRNDDTDYRGNIGIIYNAIKNGKPIPDDCEILTKEAYADLCFRASKGGIL